MQEQIPVLKESLSKLGPVNSDFAIVLEGLKENEELALTDPYLNKEETKAQTKNK